MRAPGNGHDERGLPPAVAVVIPVRDGDGDIAECLATVLPHAKALGGEVIVVDDRSSDRTAQLASAGGARVLRLERQAGPYAARNAGWRATSAPIVVFTDVRNRAEPGWLDELLAALGPPTVAIAGGTVEVRGDDRLAHRLARRESHVDPDPLLDDDFLPFVTTSSMAIRRGALESVGGFTEIRSGADAELCWRVQLAGLGSIAAAPRSRMTCLPRSSVFDIWRQWRRYARSYVSVRSRFAADGADIRLPMEDYRVKQWLGYGYERATRGPDRDPLLELADAVRWLGYEMAYRRARLRAPRLDEGRLRVVYVVDEWVTLSQTFIREEIRELRRQGAHVQVLALREGDTEPVPDEAALHLPHFEPTTRFARATTVIRSPTAALRLAQAQRRMRPERVLYRFTLLRLARLVRPPGVDWVHAHFGWEASGAAEALAAILGTGWSFTAHANDIFVTNEHLGGKLTRADGLVTVCRYNAVEIERQHAVVPPTEIVVCGVELPELTAVEALVDVLAVGRLVPKKGFDLLIRAAALLRTSRPDLTVEIIGDGPERAALERLVDELGVAGNVTLTGATPHEATLARMTRSRVVCLPARIAPDGDRDSMPVVLKEAMARRVSVVGTDVVGIPEMVDETVGRLVPPEDAEALAAALAELLGDDQLRAELGASGRARVAERYTLAGEVRRLHDSFLRWSAERPARLHP